MIWTRLKPVMAVKIFNILQRTIGKFYSGLFPQWHDYFRQNSKTSKFHACLFVCFSSIHSCTITESWPLFWFLERAWSSWCVVWEVSPTRNSTLKIAKGILCGQETGNWFCTCHGRVWIQKWSLYSCLWWYCGVCWVQGYNTRGKIYLEFEAEMHFFLWNLKSSLNVISQELDRKIREIHWMVL